MLGLGETLAARGASLDDATLRSFGTSIARQSERLAAAIRDLARASLLARREPTVSRAELTLEQITGSLEDDRVHIEAPEGLGIVADADLLAEVLRRLVANALQFSAGEVVVSAGSNGGAWIEVSDHGTGFTEEGLAGAFEPLSAGANARKDRGGLGLGLFIARRLVEAQGGTLTARTAAGEGSVFRVELPG